MVNLYIRLHKRQNSVFKSKLKFTILHLTEKFPQFQILWCKLFCVLSLAQLFTHLFQSGSPMTSDCYVVSFSFLRFWGFVVFLNLLTHSSTSIGNHFVKMRIFWEFLFSAPKLCQEPPPLYVSPMTLLLLHFGWFGLFGL